jgi:hypothetical protein
LSVALFLCAPLIAQAPTGTVAGTVTDETGALIPNVAVTVQNRDTGASRAVRTGQDGTFSAPALLAGSYDVRAEAMGFKSIVRPAEVTTGSTTTVNLTMPVGGTQETVTVEGAAANISFDSHTVQGVIDRQQIENLPLNGRSFLNLAQLEPGVIVTPANPAQFNAQFSVSILGGPASHTAITMDGSDIRNPVEGGSGQNFSQEIVQEFQLSSSNFDLSTGLTAYGAINVVTRSGSNGFHGAGYFYFRDHNLGAYPVLNRTFVSDPFFARRQSGFAVGGPVKKDKLFFFGNFEYTNQNGVYVFQPDLPSLAIFASAASAPAASRPFGVKFDYHMNPRNSAFLRYSHDGNRNQGPFGTAVPPSNYVANKNWSDQYTLGVTSVLTPSVVNDLRFSYWYWQNRNIPAPCGGCVGEGGPEVMFFGVTSNVVLGNNFNSPQGRDRRQYPLSDNLTWQIGPHRLKFGGEWEYERGTGYWGFFDPARAGLASPEYLKSLGLLGSFGLPGGVIQSYSDLSKLPVVYYIVGIGSPDQPAPYKMENARGNSRYHLYLQDTWKLSPRFTLNYGLGWLYEDNLLNYDLSKPALLAPLYGSDLSPSNKSHKNFSPAVGFAWNVDKSQKTVIRAGGGMFYDTQLAWWRLGERASLGPVGRQFLTVLPAFGSITYGTFLQQLPSLIARQNAIFPGTGTTPQILISKTVGDLGALFPKNFPTLQAQHVNAGVQHQLANNLVVTADFVYRHTIHQTPGGFFGASVDYNHYSAVTGPVIPKCPGAPNNFDPNAQCSNGQISFWYPGGNATYKALLLKVDKRFSRRYQFTASYALQDSQSINDIRLDLYNYNTSYGHDLPRHNLTISGSVDLPGHFQVSLISTLISRPPVQPIVSGISINGSDTSSSGHFALPGMEYDQFLSHADLQRLVDQYNSKYAGTLTPAGAAGITTNQKFPALSLPSHYNLGHDFTSQDIRVSKAFRFHERYEFRLIGEGFNILNIGNLTLDSFNLASPAFGQPQQRLLNGSTFGSGGPRSFQFAGRFSF